MPKLKNIPKHYIHRAVSLVLCCVFIVSAMMTGTLALALLNQHASNEF